MSAFADLVRFRATAGGTTDWTVSTAIGGCQVPSAANVQNAVSYKVYSVSDDLTQWELSVGNYTSGTTTFARTTVLYNSAGTGTATGQSGAGTKINFTLAPQVSVVALAEDLISPEVANAFTAAQKTQILTNIGAAPAITTATNSLGADTAISNSVYTDGPSMAQGTSGTWFASGAVIVTDTVGVVNIKAKLWDGTTIIDSRSVTVTVATDSFAIPLSGVITSPAANIRISCTSTAAGATSKFLFNASGNSKDCTITGVRIG